MAHLQRSTIPPGYFLNGEDEEEDFQGGLEEDDPSLSLDSNSRRRREAARLRAHQQQQQERAKQNEGIAKKESRAVFYLRLCVLIVLLCSTVAVSTAVYLYTTHKENQLRNAQFENGAETVLENVGQTLSQTLAATDGFIVQMVAYARYSNSSWPFVTLPKFGLHAAKLLQLSRAFYFSVYPIVHHDQRQEWERYANQSRSWINESLEFQARDTDWKGPVQRDYNFSYEIYASAERYHGEPFDYAIPPNTYLPSWQVSPLVPASGTGLTYNYDMWQANLWDSFTHAFENQRAVVTPPVNIPSDLNDPQSVDAATGNNYWAASLLPDRDDVSEPFSVITIPMYDSLENVRLDTTKKQPLVAVLTFSIFWQQLFQDILPEDDDELYVVFDDACSPSYTFTYRLQGPTATYMGTGDIHPTTSNQHVISAPLLNLIRHDRYSGLPLSTNFCFKTISVYPCKHKPTSGPAIYTSVAALIFFFTSIVFLAFDCSVGRRQRIVIQRALASSAIVSHLFPSERIREELYKQKIESSQNESQTASSKETASSFLQMTPNSTNNLPTPPVAPSTLAESYQHTTVLLADLVGFSSWSSHREPAAIFQVLEAIFSKMDEVASKSNIFKVDAICNSYVAASGLPKACPKHAVVMARFACDCLRLLPDILRETAEANGDTSTLELQLRIGLNTGSTTGGILRGSNFSRFQLLGETVSTAAAVQRAGVAGRVHVSHSTAHELIEHFKERWLLPREEKVHIEGREMMQTFWLVPEEIQTQGISSMKARQQ